MTDHERGPQVDERALEITFPATYPYVERLVRIFRDMPGDDTSAVVLLNYARTIDALSAVEARPAQEPVRYEALVAPLVERHVAEN